MAMEMKKKAKNSANEESEQKQKKKKCKYIYCNFYSYILHYIQRRYILTEREISSVCVWWMCITISDIYDTSAV